MSVVDLTDQEWGQVMAILSTAPWRDANPLLMKIGNQLQKSSTFNPRSVGDGKEVPDERSH